MFVRTVGRLSIGALALSALLTACSTNTASPAIPVASGSMARAALSHVVPAAQSSGILYTAQMYGHDVQIYQRNGEQLVYQKTISGNYLSQPQGSKATVNGWLYVANMGDENVLVFRTKKSYKLKGPVSTLSDYGELPNDVDLNPSRKLVAVSNKSTPSGQTGSVSVYLNRQAVPSRVLYYGTHNLIGEGIAVSHQGDCYWSFNDSVSGGGAIVQFSGCNGSGTLILSGLSQAGGIAFDQSDNLYYVDTGTATLYKCKHLSSCSPFPSGTQPFIEPIDINFDAHYKYLWVSDAGGYIDAVDPKSGQVVQNQAQGGTSDPPFGVAPEGN